jgi:hypothetical protein
MLRSFQTTGLARPLVSLDYLGTTPPYLAHTSYCVCSRVLEELGPPAPHLKKSVSRLPGLLSILLRPPNSLGH